MDTFRWIAATLCSVACSAGAGLPGADWVPVPDAALEQARGGFDNGSGLMVSLGIDRLVTVNGSVVASSQFSIADLSRMSGSEALQASAALAPSQLVQNGVNNIVTDPLMAPQALSAMFIQNSLNDQLIRSQTTINASVNTLDVMKGMNFEGGLRQALAAVLTPR